MELTNKQQLEVYDELRSVHKIVDKLFTENMTPKQENAIDAIQAVLYLAEGVFSQQDSK